MEIHCGGTSRDEHFEFVFHREALRTVINIGAEALRRMDETAANSSDT